MFKFGVGDSRSPKEEGLELRLDDDDDSLERRCISIAMAYLFYIISLVVLKKNLNLEREPFKLTAKLNDIISNRYDVED